MKRCPVCQSTYADDSLRFCLQDGATLETAASDSATDEFKTLVLPETALGSSDLPPTEVLDMGTAETVSAAERPSPPTSPHRLRDTSPVTEEALARRPKARSTAAVVALTVLATIALLALGGLASWLLLGNRRERGRRSDNAGNINATRAIENQNDAPPNNNTRTSVSNIPATASPTQSATPAPSPVSTPTQTNPAAVEAEVRVALNSWLSSFRARDLEAYMAHYADVLDTYYRARNVSRERVRGDKVRAFAKYSTIQVTLGSVSVEVDPTGRRAVATFNKSWNFSGEGVNPYTGSGLNRFTWTKRGGQWLITGEEDLSH
jgi:cytoskeletal protein RodZ